MVLGGRGAASAHQRGPGQVVGAAATPGPSNKHNTLVRAARAVACGPRWKREGGGGRGAGLDGGNLKLKMKGIKRFYHLLLLPLLLFLLLLLLPASLFCELLWSDQEDQTHLET